MLFPPLQPPPQTIFDIIGNYFLLTAGIIMILFVLFYGFFLAWRSTSSGRAIMFFVTGLVGLLTHTILTRTFGGDWPGRDIVRLVVYAYVTCTSAGLLYNLIVVWSRGNKASVALPGLPPWRERRLTKTLARMDGRSDRRPGRGRAKR